MGINLYFLIRKMENNLKLYLFSARKDIEKYSLFKKKRSHIGFSYIICNFYYLLKCFNLLLKFFFWNLNPSIKKSGGSFSKRRISDFFLKSIIKILSGSFTDVYFFCGIKTVRVECHKNITKIFKVYKNFSKEKADLNICDKKTFCNKIKKSGPGSKSNSNLEPMIKVKNSSIKKKDLLENDVTQISSYVSDNLSKLTSIVDQNITKHKDLLEQISDHSNESNLYLGKTKTRLKSIRNGKKKLYFFDSKVIFLLFVSLLLSRII